MKNNLKRISFLLALLITLSAPLSVAQAATCPPHDYRHSGTRVVQVECEKHTVYVLEYDPDYREWRHIPRTCYIRTLKNSYQYRCYRSGCIASFTEDGSSTWTTHSICYK